MGGAVYTAGRQCQGHTRSVKAPDISKVFGGDAVGFRTKQAAKGNAAESLLGYLHGLEDAESSQGSGYRCSKGLFESLDT